jgi:MFS family permease
MIGDLFPPAERGKWQGVSGSVFGLASVVGPALGGWLTDGPGWRWVFYVNLPVGILAVIVLLVGLPAIRPHEPRPIDWLGAATIICATVPLLLAFSWAGSTYPWASPPILGLLGFALVVLTLFVVVERRSAEPIISPGLFRNRTFALSVAATFLVSCGMFAAIMFLPLFVQGVAGASATSSGAVLTPLMLGFIGSSIAGGQLVARTGRYKRLTQAGFAVAAAGMFLLSRMPADATQGLVVRNMVVVGLGLGAMMSVFTIIVQNALPFAQLGQVTASLQFFRSIGGTLGVAVLGSVMTNRFQAPCRPGSSKRCHRSSWPRCRTRSCS